MEVLVEVLPWESAFAVAALLECTQQPAKLLSSFFLKE